MTINDPRRLAAMLLLAAIGLAAAAAMPASAGTLDDVKKRGWLACGVSTGVAGLSIADAKGEWTGLDADTCRAVAAAIFGDGTKVKYSALTAAQRFTAIQSGEVDLLSRQTTWTLERDTALGLSFTVVNYYDGQGFLVPKRLGIKSAKELGGATICVQTGSTTEANLADYFKANKMAFKPLAIEKLEEVENAFFSGRCDVYLGDRSGLAGTRLGKAPKPDDYVVLPEIISKEPLAPVVRHGDDEWFDVVKWVVYALIDAEEKGVTKANVDEMTKSDDPEVKRMLGVTPGMGKALHLDEKWAYNAIKTVGNYGEIFDRNVGKDSPLKLERGLNELWSKGGLMYAPPIR